MTIVTENSEKRSGCRTENGSLFYWLVVWPLTEGEKIKNRRQNGKIPILSPVLPDTWNPVIYPYYDEKQESG